MPNSYPPKTLVVSSFSSKCGDCGKSADPTAQTHGVLLGCGPTNGDPGCGVEWKNVTTDYCAPGIEAATRRLRPDLNYIGPLDSEQPLKARTTFEHEWAAPATELPAVRTWIDGKSTEQALEEALVVLRRLDKATQRVFREFHEPNDAQEPWNELLAARVKAVGVLAKHRKDNT